MNLLTRKYARAMEIYLKVLEYIKITGKSKELLPDILIKLSECYKSTGKFSEAIVRRREEHSCLFIRFFFPLSSSSFFKCAEIPYGGLEYFSEKFDRS